VVDTVFVVFKQKMGDGYENMNCMFGD